MGCYAAHYKLKSLALVCIDHNYVLLIQVCVLVQGGYLVQMRLNGYSNPTGKCGHGDCRTSSGQLHCCDNPYNTRSCKNNERCDSYFKYCLKPFDEVRLNQSRCLTNQKSATTLGYNHNDGPLNFSQNTVLGLDNPLNLTSLEDAYNVSHLYTFSV